MESKRGLLERACEGIGELDRPACIRDGQLRYVAVNSAYARFFNCSPDDLVGKASYGSENLRNGGRDDEDLRIDKQRRCLVFGTDEIITYVSPVEATRHQARLERFADESGRLFLLCMFDEAVVAPAPPLPAARNETVDAGLFRAAMEQMPVAVFIRDSERRLVYANEAYEIFLGGKRERFMGMTEEEMFPDVGDMLKRDNIRLLEDGCSLERESQAPMSDGTSVPVITRLARIDACSDAGYIVGSITDVSNIRKRDGELEKARQDEMRLNLYFESILKTLPVGLIVIGTDRHVEYINAALEDMWPEIDATGLVGLPVEEFIKASFDGGYYDHLGSDLESVMAVLREKLMGEHATSLEFSNHGGRLILVTCRALPDGRLLISNVDITEIRQREKEAGEARAELERVGQVMRDTAQVMAQGLAVIEDGHFILTNESLRSMLDVPEELCGVGQPWRGCFDYCVARGDFGDRQQTSEVVATIRSNLRADRPFSLSFQVGGKRWLQMESTVGARGHWLLVITDVTEMKQREAELTMLLTRAEAADRAKSEFLANMSHEIRTPMNGVLGMAELLARSQLDTRQKSFIDVIVKSGNALLTIINDILDFSRIDAGQMKLRQAAFDPVEAVEDVVTLLSSQAAEKDIELLVRSQESLCRMVMGDAGRFRQIVTNLVGNAIKFTERGHVLIDLSSEDAEDAEVLLSLRVEDTGTGIAPDRLGSIFDKFSQIDSSTTRRHEGTGLGLAITAGLVSLFSGWLGVESEQGKGTTFTVKLPLRRASRQPGMLKVPVIAQGAHVLVIEDSEINRQILCGQLSSWGFDCHGVQDEESALAILEQAQGLGLNVDAVVIDSHMPGDGGIGIVRRIRSDRRLDDVAIVFLNSIDMVADDAVLEALNVQGHLMKPVRAALLHTTLCDVVRAGRIRKGMTQQAVKPGTNAGGASAFQPSRQDVTIEAAGLLPAMQSSGTGTRLDVLVAEDNDVNQIVFSQILQATGLAFMIVGNGKEALDAWISGRPAVVLMDVSMPVMNGHEATRAIREQERLEGRGEHVPVIGVTAHALESDSAACLAAGMDDYLGKPISPELLEDKIARWLGREIPRRNTSMI